MFFKNKKNEIRPGMVAVWPEDDGLSIGTGAIALKAAREWHSFPARWRRFLDAQHDAFRVLRPQYKLKPKKIAAKKGWTPSVDPLIFLIHQEAKEQAQAIVKEALTNAFDELENKYILVPKQQAEPVKEQSTETEPEAWI